MDRLGNKTESLMKNGYAADGQVTAKSFCNKDRGIVRQICGDPKVFFVIIASHPSFVRVNPAKRDDLYFPGQIGLPDLVQSRKRVVRPHQDLVFYDRGKRNCLKLSRINWLQQHP